jgi:tetratricopeptide (TPR) repeat protein
MPARNKHASARRRFLLTVAVVICAAGGLSYYSTLAPDDDFESTMERASSAIARLDWEEAQAELARLHRARPGDAVVIRIAAQVAQRRGDAAAAIDWLQRVPEADLEFTEFRLIAARLALEDARPAQTERLLLSALRKDPEFVEARRILVRLYLILIRLTEMREQIAAIDVRGKASLDELLLFTLGSRGSWTTNDHFDWLGKAREREPENVEVVAALGYYLVQQSRRPEARKLLQSFAASGHRDWMRQLVVAEDEIDEGRYAPARDRLEALSPDADKDERVWLARGRVYYETSDWQSAQTAYATAEALDPCDPAAAYGTARTAQRRGDAEAAQASFERADRLQRLLARQSLVMQEHEPTAEQYADLAAAFEKADQPRMALACWRHILQMAAAPRSSALAAARQAVDRLSEERDQLHLRAWEPSGWQRLHAAADSLRPTAGANRQPVRGRDEKAGADDRQPRPELRLDDVAHRAGLTFEYDHGRSLYRWLMQVNGGGVAVLDYDRDGCPDLFLSQGCRLPVVDADSGASGRLFRNHGGQAFVDVTPLAGAKQSGFGQGCAAGDVDNDGFPDLVVCRYGSVLFYRNQGDGTLDEIAEASGLIDSGWSTSAAFGDFDRDGDLDLYVVHYVQAPFETLTPCGKEGHFMICRPLIYPAERDRLWENLGDGRWADRTSSAGLTSVDGKGLGIVVCDFDYDGWPDLFVGNDTTPNFLYHNLGGAGERRDSPFAFEEVGIPSGVAFNRDGGSQASMGIACDDADGDGLFDLYVSNFVDESDSFYHNLGSLAFAEEAHPFGLADASVTVMGWGTQFLDLDGDRRPDLFVANGDLLDVEQRPVLYWNTGRKRFLNVSAAAGPFFGIPRMGRSVALCDWNGDLAPDLVVTHQSGPVALLENHCRGGGRIAIHCVGTIGNRDAEGAVVTAVIGGETTVHRVTSGGGFFAANESTVLIGTGNADAVDRLEIRWPSGGRSEFHGLRVGAAYLVVEGRENSLRALTHVTPDETNPKR